ncbi:MAG: methionine biosynthesis protein MetW [Gammaproteobacteria bacterium]|nr:methionine biosynthesis protein MetW [Gammaproteobacteria bacterium]
MRTDQALIAEWIKPGSRVLDLGCGDGTMMAHLQQKCDVWGYGLEIDEENIVKCIASGVNVIQTDLDAGLSEFDEESFDYVIMTQTLQAIRYPDRLLNDMLRIGREGIVTFPNMGHWKCRLQIALKGMMPKSRTLPYEWYNTPNIHMCTLKDFESLCRKVNIEILQCTTVDYAHRSNLGMRLFPNLLGEIAIYRFRRYQAN